MSERTRPPDALERGDRKQDALLDRDAFGASETSAAMHHLRDMLEVALKRIEALEARL